MNDLELQPESAHQVISINIRATHNSVNPSNTHSQKMQITDKAKQHFTVAEFQFFSESNYYSCF